MLDEGEVVLIMGMPASGKTTRARYYEARGYERLNRDDRGGTLASLARALDAQLAAGARRLVLDNTYASRADRGLIVEIAGRYGVPVACEHVAVSTEQAQRQAVQRMLAAHGRLLEPEEMNSKGKTDPSTIPPRALFAWQRAFESPSLDEGFISLRELAPGSPPANAVAGKRANGSGSERANGSTDERANGSVGERANGSAGERVNASTGERSIPALLLELDELVWRGRPERAAEVQLLPGVAEAIAGWRAAGWSLAGTLWRPQAPSEPLLAALAELLGFELPAAVCAHPAGPPLCWCRKPLPGMALLLARDLGFDLTASWHLGRGPADRGFASRAGCGYLDASSGLAFLTVPSPASPS